MKSDYITPIDPSHPELPAVISYSIGSPTDVKVQKILDGYKDQNNPLIGYFIGSQLVGLIGLKISQTSATIQHISVLPKYQSNGIGKILVHYVIKHFSLKIISAETDEEAVGFYRAMGFECTTFVGQYGKRYRCVLNCSKLSLRDLYTRDDKTNCTPQNIMIVGCSGSGKSTLAERLSQLTGLKVIYMDHLYWEPGWVLRSQEKIADLLTHEIANDGWICDGNNSSSFAVRVPKADLLIWLDLPRRTCIWRVMKRIAMHHGMTRDDLPPGCVDRFDWNFLKWVWNFKKNSRPKLEKLYQETESQLERFHLKSQQEVDRFIEAMQVKIHGR